MMMWIWIDLRLIVTSVWLLLLLLLLFVLLHSSFIFLLFSGTERNETKLKYIESFTFRHFSSEFRFVASVRYNPNLSSAFLFIFSFFVCFMSHVHEYISQSRETLFVFKRWRRRCVSGYLWQICGRFQFVCHFFVSLALSLPLGIIVVCANAIVNIYIWLEMSTGAVTTHFYFRAKQPIFGLNVLNMKIDRQCTITYVIAMVLLRPATVCVQTVKIAHFHKSYANMNKIKYFSCAYEDNQKSYRPTKRSTDRPTD